MKTTLPIEVDPEIMSGTPVFRGSRVPVQSLFEYLEDDISLEKFLECFPTVRREDAVAVLEHSKTELLAEALDRRLGQGGERCADPASGG